MKRYFKIETKRLIIRIINEEDARFMLKLMNTEKWLLNIGDRKVNTEEDARRYINSKMGSQLSAKGFINHIMIDKKKSVAVGTCSIHDREGIEGLDIGYALLPEYEGLGYATEGATMMAQLAFKQFKQQKISAITKDQNFGSGKVLEKIGFQHQSYIRLPHEQEDLKFYALEKKIFEENVKTLADKTYKQ